MSITPENNTENLADSRLPKKSSPVMVWGLWLCVGAMMIYGYYEYQRWMNPSVAEAASVVDCYTSNEACTALFEKGELTFIMLSESEQIYALDTVRVIVELPEQFELNSQVQIDLLGINEDMGLLRTPLTPMGNGQYIAQIFIPICVETEMLWQARIRVKQSSGIYDARFNFNSYSRSQSYVTTEAKYE